MEHNQDVIRAADHIIELGPDAGDAGGQLIFQGTPEELASNKIVREKYLTESFELRKKDFQKLAEERGGKK